MQRSLPRTLAGGARRLLPPALLAVVAGCHIPDLKPPVSVPHPLLSGDGTMTMKVPVLEQRFWSKSDDECSPWPLENDYTIRVTEAEICLEATRYDLTLNEQDQLTTRARALVLTEKGPVAYFEMHQLQDPKRVGECSFYGGLVKGTIWRVAVGACTPNEGRVTEETEELAVKPGAVDQAIFRFQKEEK